MTSANQSSISFSASSASLTDESLHLDSALSTVSYYPSRPQYASSSSNKRRCRDAVTLFNTVTTIGIGVILFLFIRAQQRPVITSSLSIEYASQKDGCKEGMCKNNGTCETNPKSQKPCKCLPGFHGTLCGNIDFCYSNPCYNGGICDNEDNQYKCTCAKGFEGNECQYELYSLFTDYCSNVICQHNGTCLTVVRNFLCVCAIGYFGKYCEAGFDSILPTEMTQKVRDKYEAMLNMDYKQWSQTIHEYQRELEEEIRNIKLLSTLRISELNETVKKFEEELKKNADIVNTLRSEDMRKWNQTIKRYENYSKTLFEEVKVLMNTDAINWNQTVQKLANDFKKESEQLRQAMTLNADEVNRTMNLLEIGLKQEFKQITKRVTMEKDKWNRTISNYGSELQEEIKKLKQLGLMNANWIQLFANELREIKNSSATYLRELSYKLSQSDRNITLLMEAVTNLELIGKSIHLSGGRQNCTGNPTYDVTKTLWFTEQIIAANAKQTFKYNNKEAYVVVPYTGRYFTYAQIAVINTKTSRRAEYTIRLFPNNAELLRCYTRVDPNGPNNQLLYCSMSATKTLQATNLLRIVNQDGVNDCLAKTSIIDYRQTFWGLIYLGP